MSSQPFEPVFDALQAVEMQNFETNQTPKPAKKPCVAALHQGRRLHYNCKGSEGIKGNISGSLTFIDF